MEGKSASCPEGVVSWYIRTSRLAVALAIIKLRPPGGARQFTESLAERLKRQDESWKSKAESLHEDLLHLRQELLLTRTLLNTRSCAGQAPAFTGQEIAKVLSQDDTREVNSGTLQTCLPPTPPNSQKVPPKDRQWRQDHRLTKHVQFLQRLSGLRSGFEESLCQDGDVVWDSVVQLLDCVVEDFRQAHTGQPLRHPEQLHNAIQVVAQTLSPGGARQGFPVQHFSRVEDLLKEMVKLLLTNQQLNAFSVQDSLSDCLLALGGNCCITRTPLIQLLMSQIIQLAQQLGDACEALGNHEFDNGVDGLLKPFLQEVNCTVLSANIKADETLAPRISGYYFPYKIFTLGSEKVGVVGYTSAETPALSLPGPHLKFEDEITALQPQVDKLLTLGVNKIIALGHSGFLMDQMIAKKVQGVDVVIGGHTNTFLYTGDPPSTEVPAGPYPLMVKSDDGRQVPVVQAYAFGKYLGFLKVTFDANGNVLESTGNPILLNSSVEPDPDIQAKVDSWRMNLANYSSQQVGQTLVFLNGTFEECRFRECNLGNLICDAMVHHNIKYADELQWNHVSSCILNGGGIRAPIDERNRNGSITMEDLIAVLPFGGTFDLVQLNGSTLLEAFEHSVRRHGGNTGEFLQVSGFQVVYDLSKAPGSRVKSVKVLCTQCRVPHYEPLVPNKVYKVVLPSYLVDGGDGFTMIKEQKLKHDSGDLDISVVAGYISERKRVHPAVEGRIQFSSSCAGLRGYTSTVLLLWAVWLMLV